MMFTWAGSTTMRKYFTSMLNIKFDWKDATMKPFNIHYLSTREKLQLLSKQGLESGLYVFTVIRHPFAHLVSAYGDFITRKLPSYFGLNSPYWFHNVSADQPLSPTQMAEFLVYTDLWRHTLGHFAPYEESCNSCDFDFDAIVDVGELSDMIQQIANNLNITAWHKPPIHANERENMFAYDVGQKFFSNITLSMTKKLYEFYRLDFELFGYDPEPFYKYCQND